MIVWLCKFQLSSPIHGTTILALGIGIFKASVVLIRVVLNGGQAPRYSEDPRLVIDPTIHGSDG